jgi:uncharacterized coiled-coil DUF342 family protein
MTEEMGAGVVLLHRKDVQLVQSVWHLSADISVKEYLASVRYIKQDVDHLLAKYPSQSPVERELTHLKTMTRELIDKIATLEQMLPTANWSKRGILSVVSKTLKFLFGTALSNDILKLDQKVEELKTQQGNLLHDVTNQITVTRDLDDNIKNNAKKLTTLMGTMKQQATSSRRVFEAIVMRDNGTRQMVEQNALISSYIGR